jgi:antitoxin component YwqK of YwqJK toxin-antitoxin module
MRRLFVLLLGLTVLTCCNPNRLPPNRLIENRDPNLKKSDSGWFYKGRPFNGYMVERDRDGTVLYQLPIINGHEEGTARGRFNTGEKLMVRRFKNGLQEGSFEQWWPNGHYHYLFRYKAGKMDGRQLVFYPDGKKRQESNYENGREEGLQRAWNPDGSLASNYVIKANKLYGIIRVKSCFPHGH